MITFTFHHHKLTKKESLFLVGPLFFSFLLFIFIIVDKFTIQLITVNVAKLLIVVNTISCLIFLMQLNKLKEKYPSEKNE